MDKFVIYGNYTPEAMKGFISQPDQNRRVAAEMISEAVGAELLDFFLTKGEYDFVALGRGTSEQILAIKMATMASGSLFNVHVLEEVDLKEPATLASEALASYKTPSSLGAS